MAFVIGFIQFSACPLAFDYNGVSRSCLTPFLLMKVAKFLLSNGSPLSLLIILGIP